MASTTYPEPRGCDIYIPGDRPNGRATPAHRITALLREPDPYHASASLEAVTRDFDAAGLAPSHGMHRLAWILFGDDPPRTAAAVAARLAQTERALTSRFMRAGLPSPRRYVDHAMLVRVAAIAERPDFTAAAAARLLELEPQHLHRWIRAVTGGTFNAWRPRARASAALDDFRRAFIAPYLATWAGGRDPLRPLQLLYAS
jgi:hypothetical protein